MPRFAAKSAIAAVTFALLVAACDGGDHTSSDQQTTASAGSATTETANTIFASDAEALWITDADSGNLVRVDAAGPNQITGVEIGVAPSSVAVSHDLVWVVDGNTVHVLEPATAAVEADISLDTAVAVVDTPDRPWALAGSQVVPLDPETFEPGPAIPLTDPVAGVASNTHLWVVRSGELVGIDLTSGEQVSSVVLPNTDPAAVALLESRVVVIGREGTVIAVDADAGAVVGETALGVAAVPVGGVVTESGGLWVLDEAGQVIRLEGDLTVAHSIELESTPTAGAVASGALWVISVQDRALIRVDLGEFSTVSFPIDASPTAIAAD